MEDRHQQIKQYLQDPIVQKRIFENMQRANDEATVTISNAAHLFGFSENQLRDWDEKGLLKSQRRPQDAEQDGKGARRRQYTFAELNKLAVIYELLERGDFSIGTIPRYVDEIWDEVASQTQQKSQLPEIERKDAKHVHIDERLELADRQFFWDFYVYTALRLSLMLIRENVPDTIIGLVLPIQPFTIPMKDVRPHNLHELGPCLIGWLRSNESFYVFLEAKPSFELPSDFRMHPLEAMKDNNALPGANAQNNLFIVVQRKTKPITLDISTVETMHRLLVPIYEYKDEWQHSFSQGYHHEVFPTTNFNSSSNFVDDTLNRLANLIIHMGGCTLANQNRWRFCCILSPRIYLNNAILPMQHHRLIVRAQSEFSPYEISKTYVSPDKTVIALSMRAYLSGQVVYRPVVVAEDETIALREIEGEIGSAIAIPVEDEDGLAMAVMYIVSQPEETGAFPENDQRWLRMIGRMIQELLLTYRNRQQVTSRLKNIIEKPGVGDGIVGKFYSENRFIRDLEALLTTIQKTMPAQGTEAGDKDLSFICLDIDEQSNLGNMLGDLANRNLSWELGERLHVQLAKHFGRSADWHFYYIFGGRFYIILDKISQDVAGENAVLLQEDLRGVHEVDALRTTLDQPTSPANVLKLPDITIRLGVTSYKYWKLAELLDRYASEFPVTNVRSLITRYLDIALVECKKDSIVGWERTEKKFKPWPF